MRIIWTDYMWYRIEVRGFDTHDIKNILRYSDERYRDTVTDRRIAIGISGEKLLMIPFEQEGDSLTPVTVHATSRQQVRFRINTGRFTNE